MSVEPVFTKEVSGSIIVDGNIEIYRTIDETIGVICKDGIRIMHDYPNGTNLFVGGLAGNFTNAGTFNSTLGTLCLNNLTTGGYNLCCGYRSMEYSTTLNNCVALGSYSLQNANGNNLIGIGYESGLNYTTESNNIVIGNAGVIGDGDTIRIGGSHTKNIQSGIYSSLAPNAQPLPVMIDELGQLCINNTMLASITSIAVIADTETLLSALNPAQYVIGGNTTYGLITEEVEIVSPTLITKNVSNVATGINTNALIALLLKDHQRLINEVNTLKSEVELLKNP
jgi:hypothetical protein